jgi:hypothetical protein
MSDNRSDLLPIPLKFITPTIKLPISLASLTRIKCISQSISQQIIQGDGDKNSKAWHNNKPPGRDITSGTS